MNRKKITEACDVGLYKNLLTVFGDYVKSFPCTGVDNLFDALIDGGKKLLPSDRQALAILEHLVCTIVPDVVQKILNIRFADLDAAVKPVSKKGNRHEVAHWVQNGNITDRVKDLINWEDKGQGHWCNVDGEKVTLVTK